MASITGKAGYVTKQVSGVDTVVDAVREWSIDYVTDVIDITEFLETAPTHKSTMTVLKSATASFIGNHTDGDTGLDLGTSYNMLLVADASRAFYGAAIVNSKSPSVAVTGEATMTYNITFNGYVYVMGANLVVNGTFATDASWDKGTDWTIPEDNTAVVDGQGAAGNLEASSDPLSATTKYFTQYTISAFTDGSIIIDVGTTDGTSRTATGTYTEIITSGGDGTLVFTPSVSATLKIGTVIVREILN